MSDWYSSIPKCFVDGDPCVCYDSFLCNENCCSVYTREAYLASLGLVGKIIKWFDKNNEE